MKYQANYDYRFPCRLLYGFLKKDGMNLQIPTAFPSASEWGEIKESAEEFQIKGFAEFNLELSWISDLTEKSYYFSVPVRLPIEIVENDDITLLCGLAPSGEVAVWLAHKLKSILYLSATAVDISTRLTDCMIEESDIKSSDGERIETIRELCRNDLKLFMGVRGFDPDIEIPRNLFGSRMRQFNQKYCVECVWNDYDLKFSIMRFDGTYDKLEMDTEFQYEMYGSPKKIRLTLKEGLDEYGIFFWFDEDIISNVYSKFYGAHPETKSDFIIRVDPSRRKYELALYRQGLREPQPIPESAYQLLVFKNGFEDFRSANYHQPRGAWLS